MRRTILALTAMLAALILGSGMALALADAGPVGGTDSSFTASSCNFDMMEFLRQLGVLPPQGEPREASLAGDER